MVDYHEGELGGHRYRVHREEQVLALSVPPEAHGTPLRATLQRSSYRPFVSASVLAQKAKQFDDGLYAAVELAAQHGLGTFKGKQGTLARLLEHLRGHGETRATLEAALALGRGTEPARDEARRIRDAFLADSSRSKPLGFYGWREELGWIFRQDRLLQDDLAAHADLIDVVRAIHADAGVRAAYEQNLALVSRLTNPLARADLRPMLRALDASGDPGSPPREVSFVPPSIAHETELVKRLYGDRPIPDGFDVLGEVIAAVRSGTIDLTPREASGWYDVQTWTLETLVAPARATEASRLVLDATYEKHLESLFRGIMTLTRETHIKQLEMVPAGCAAPRVVKIPVRPQLTVEPLVTHYLRCADGYRFVRGVLEEAFGERALGEMHRLLPDKPTTASLREELAAMIHLFDGAAATAMRELGIKTERDPSGFTGWAALPNDPDVDADARAMVPVYYDVQRRKTKVLLFLGWSEGQLRASFAKPPRVELVSGGHAEVELGDAWYPLASPVVAEALVTRILNRDELREHCDKHRTKDAIIAALT
jgi:hypothetical protein